MRVIALLAFYFAAASAIPLESQRISGGEYTTISEYPAIASLAYRFYDDTFMHYCGASILSYRSVLTSARCLHGEFIDHLRVRVGSTYSNSSGVSHHAARIIIHGGYSITTHANNIGILHVSNTIVFNENVSPAFIPNRNYTLNDNEDVWIAGWGANRDYGDISEQLRHFQAKIIDHETCLVRYSYEDILIRPSMICAGHLDDEDGNRGTCMEDQGGPIYHNGVVVGIIVYYYGCNNSHYPTVGTRVSSYTPWIINFA